MDILFEYFVRQITCVTEVFLGLHRSPLRDSNPLISLLILLTQSFFSSNVSVVMVRLGVSVSLLVSCNSNSISFPPLAMSRTCILLMRNLCQNLYSSRSPSSVILTLPPFSPFSHVTVTRSSVCLMR